MRPIDCFRQVATLTVEDYELTEELRRRGADVHDAPSTWDPGAQVDELLAEYYAAAGEKGVDRELAQRALLAVTFAYVANLNSVLSRMLRRSPTECWALLRSVEEQHGVNP